MPRLNIGSALAADGKRIRGANRNGDGHYETATLVAHDTGLPVASLGFNDKNGEQSAIRALFEQVPLAGRAITVDALHTTKDTARSIVETHKADYLMTVKKNASETYETLSTIDWARDATGAFEEKPNKKGNCSPRYAARSYCLIMSAAFPSSAIRMASIGLYPSSAIESR